MLTKVDLDYVPVYERIADEVGDSGRVCELGVYQGASLELWKELFPKSDVIVGVDHDDASTWPVGTHKLIADQTSMALVEILRNISVKYDLIVDDASHNGKETATSFRNLWPLIESGGYYVIEDWMVGFPGWKEYDNSMLVFAQNQLTHFKEPGGDIESIEYRYGMIVCKHA